MYLNLIRKLYCAIQILNLQCDRLIHRFNQWLENWLDQCVHSIPINVEGFGALSNASSCSGLLPSPKCDCQFSSTQHSNPIYGKLTSPLYYLLLLVTGSLPCPSSSSSLLGLSASLVSLPCQAASLFTSQFVWPCSLLVWDILCVVLVFGELGLCFLPLACMEATLRKSPFSCPVNMVGSVLGFLPPLCT